MKIIILGAGQVGSSAAENLVSEAHDITVVDTDAARLANLQENPFAALVVDRYDDDWTHLGWVMVQGHAEILASGPEHTTAPRPPFAPATPSSPPCASNSFR